MASAAPALQIARLEKSHLEAVRLWFRAPDFCYLTTRPYLLDSGAIQRIMGHPGRQFFLLSYESRPVALAHWEADGENPRIGSAGFRLAPGESQSLGLPALNLFVKTLLALYNPAILLHHAYAFDQQIPLWTSAGFVRRGIERQAAYRGGRRWDRHIYQYRGGKEHA